MPELPIRGLDVYFLNKIVSTLFATSSKILKICVTCHILTTMTWHTYYNENYITSMHVTSQQSGTLSSRMHCIKYRDFT